MSKARGIEHACHANHHVARHAAGALQRPYHGVERVGDDDDEGAWGVFLDARAHLLHHLDVNADEVVSAHAGLAWNAGSYDAYVGTFDVRIGVGAFETAIETLHRARLGDVERLALW